MQMEANGEPVGDGDDEAPSSSSRGVRASELVRATWHAFPGVLTLWILRTDFATMPLREWRAVPVAAVLAPLTATCWLLEWARLVGPLRTHAILSPLLRENEHARIHGTAWYLLGVTAALFMFPADVAVCAICQLAFCDPVASIAGRVFGDFRCFGGRYGRGGKSVIGTFACFWSGSLVAWFLYCGVYVVMPDGDASEWARFLGGSALSAATAIEDEENVWTMLALCVASGVAVAAVGGCGYARGVGGDGRAARGVVIRSCLWSWTAPRMIIWRFPFSAARRCTPCVSRSWARGATASGTLFTTRRCRPRAITETKRFSFK